MTEQKTKVPSQFFQWFESLKQGYENSIDKLFNRVEAVNEDHKKQMTTVYQGQIDTLKDSQSDHLNTLKDSYQNQTTQANERIRQLERDVQFYQDQIKSQNQNIEKLNARYDVVLFALKDRLDNKEIEHIIKDISPSDDTPPSLHNHQSTAIGSDTPPVDETPVTDEIKDNVEEKAESRTSEQVQSETPEPLQNLHQNNQSTESEPEPRHEPKTESTPEPQMANDFIQQVSAKMAHTHQDDHVQEQSTEKQTESNPSQEIIEQAFTARQQQSYEHAYELFLAAANLGNEKAMGAIGRAHFVGEGTTLDKPTGLAWLILAAEHNFEPAIKKTAAAKAKSPALYQAATEISIGLLTETTHNY